MYCKICDREVSHWHRCFVTGASKPLERKPRLNTRLARKMAQMYQECHGHEFPGGNDNARIRRVNKMGYDEAFSWKLEPINPNIVDMVINFGSQWTATQCSKSKDYEFYTGGDGFTSEIILNDGGRDDLENFK